jgi:hypothetical protein
MALPTCPNRFARALDSLSKRVGDARPSLLIFTSTKNAVATVTSSNGDGREATILPPELG